MATSNEDETKDCTFEWKIENASECWWLKMGNGIESPTFVADALMGTKWSLWLYPAGETSENFVAVFLKRKKDCCGPNIIEVIMQFAFLGKDGNVLKEGILKKHSFVKDESWGCPKFVRRKRVFITEKDAFLPADTLTVQCTLRKIDENLVSSTCLYGRTTLKVIRKSFNWRMDNFSSLEPGLRKNFKDTLFHFDLVLKEDCDRLDIDVILLDDCVEYISFNSSVVNSEGKKENCGIKNYFTSDLQKGVLSPVMGFPKKWTDDNSRYLPNDTLSLDFEFAFSIVENSGSEKGTRMSAKDVKMNECLDGVEKYQDSEILINDLKSLYIDGIFSNTEIQTSTKSFPAHKGMLSARSPVFRRMFENDMKEANSGHVVISDFEDDTVHRMLIYIYTGTLQDLSFESVIELYKIADKYEILSLKNKCSAYLKDNLCPTQVCDVLILSDLRQDGDLKSAAQAYILAHNQVFESLEWKNFMDSNMKLAADIMYMKVNPGMIYKGKI